MLSLRPLKEDGAWGAKCKKGYDLDEHGQRIRSASGTYKSHRIDKIATIHMGVAAHQMEQKGIATDKGNINREIVAQNKLLKEMKARVTRLYNWSKENEKQPEKASILDFLQQHRQDKPTTTYGKVKALKESAALFHFLQSNGIGAMSRKSTN